MTTLAYTRGFHSVAWWVYELRFCNAECATFAPLEHPQNAPADARKERFRARQNALQTALAGLLIACGNGCGTAERKAADAMKRDWKRVRGELECWGYVYLDMQWKER